jgi:hypothetical protein
MSKPDTAKAWEILASRKAERKENRTAFLAALIMERCKPCPSGLTVKEPSPFMAQAFAVELVRLAGAIHRLCEADCNCGLTERQESRLDKLKARFSDIATALGFNARTGGDPRGACAYLEDPANPQAGDGWGGGWPVYS